MVNAHTDVTPLHFITRYSEIEHLFKCIELNSTIFLSSSIPLVRHGYRWNTG